MPSDAPAIKRARVEADGAEVVVVGPASDERRRGGRASSPRARPRDHPALRRRPDHRGPGHGRAGDRRGPAGSRRRARPDRRRRAGQRRRRGDPGARARTRGSSASSPSSPRTRGESLRDGRIVALAGGAREPDDRGRDAHPVDRPPELRPPAAPARRRRDGDRGSRSRRRSGWPPRRRGWSSSRRARWRSRRCGSTPPRRACAGSTARSSPSSAAATSTPTRYLELPPGADPARGLSQPGGGSGLGRPSPRPLGRAPRPRAGPPARGSPRAPPRAADPRATRPRSSCAHPRQVDPIRIASMNTMSPAEPHDPAGELLVGERR